MFIHVIPSPRFSGAVLTGLGRAKIRLSKSENHRLDVNISRFQFLRHPFLPSHVGVHINSIICNHHSAKNMDTTISVFFLHITPSCLCLEGFQSLFKRQRERYYSFLWPGNTNFTLIDFSRVWTREPWISRHARHPETTEADWLPQLISKIGERLVKMKEEKKQKRKQKGIEIKRG